MDKILEMVLKKLDALSEFIDVDGLVALGLYKDKNETYRSRLKGNSPHYIQIKRKILYPKEALREFIISCWNNGSIPLRSRKEVFKK